MTSQKTDEILNPVELAERNLSEAKRQLADAVEAQSQGKIGQDRVDQLTRLRDICVEDLNRVLREN